MGEGGGETEHSLLLRLPSPDGVRPAHTTEPVCLRLQIQMLFSSGNTQNDALMSGHPRAQLRHKAHPTPTQRTRAPHTCCAGGGPGEGHAVCRCGMNSPTALSYPRILSDQTSASPTVHPGCVLPWAHERPIHAPVRCALDTQPATAFPDLRVCLSAIGRRTLRSRGVLFL